MGSWTRTCRRVRNGRCPWMAATRKHTRAADSNNGQTQPERARAGPPDVYATTHTAGLESLERTAAAAARADRGISCSAERAAAARGRVKGRRNGAATYVAAAAVLVGAAQTRRTKKLVVGGQGASCVSLTAYYYYYYTTNGGGGGAAHGSQRRRATKTRGPRAHHRAVSSWEPMSPPAGVRTTDVHSAGTARGAGAVQRSYSRNVFRSLSPYVRLFPRTFFFCFFLTPRTQMDSTIIIRALHVSRHYPRAARRIPRARVLHPGGPPSNDDTHAFAGSRKENRKMIGFRFTVFIRLVPSTHTHTGFVCISSDSSATACE